MAFDESSVVLVLAGKTDIGTATHEIMHILVGRKTEGSINLPLWLNEGLAEYANRDTTITYDLYLDWAIGTNQLKPLSQLQTFPGDPKLTLVSYGQSRSVDKDKVGKDLNEAIYTKNNNALNFFDVPKTGVTVDRGMTHDGVGEYLADVIDVEKDQNKPGSQTSDIVQILREKEVDVVINYLPVGSEQATKWYVEHIMGFSLAGLFGGSLIVEILYGIPGVGRISLDSVYSRDYPVIMAIVLLGSSALVVANLIIDFTIPKCTFQVLKIALKLKKRVVIGTTGFSKKEENLIKKYSKKIPILKAGNMSLGINLLHIFHLLEI